jgi:HAE1 family hydrophobic/amphiphilic exporter-1
LNKYSGRFTTEKQYANIILRSNPDGEILRLKDVANIEFGSSMYDIYSNLNGKPSAAIVLKQSFGSNANQVIEDVKKLENKKIS